MSNLMSDLTEVLNRHSAENGSDTPDFILAQFLIGCLQAWDANVTAREIWYGRDKRRVEPSSAQSAPESP